jgi:hypothetical protein
LLERDHFGRDLGGQLPGDCRIPPGRGLKVSEGGGARSAGTQLVGEIGDRILPGAAEIAAPRSVGENDGDALIRGLGARPLSLSSRMIARAHPDGC